MAEGAHMNEIATLDDFVFQALKDIASAVQRFDREAPEGMTVRPMLQSAPAGNISTAAEGAVVIYVEFDVATSTELVKSRNGDMGLAVSIVRAGGSKSSADTTRTENRLRFPLPLQLGRGVDAIKATKEHEEQMVAFNRLTAGFAPE